MRWNIIQETYCTLTFSLLILKILKTILKFSFIRPISRITLFLNMIDRESNRNSNKSSLIVFDGCCIFITNLKKKK